MRIYRIGLLSMAVLLGFTAGARAVTAPLPDAPEPQPVPQEHAAVVMPAERPNFYPKIAPKYNVYIHPGQTSQALNGKEKIILAFNEDLDGSIPLTALLSAGLSHVDNSDPKYGTDKGAFGERYGAAMIRQTSQAFFSVGIAADIFHDDPRYYVMGDGHSFMKRAVYAATRIVTTRADNGEQRPNAPLWTGYLAAAALTQAYYPSSSRGASVVFESYGISLAAVALGYEFHEFLGDGLRAVHLRKD